MKRESTLPVLLSDVQVLGLTIWGEARGEEIEGKIAVGCVIRNRVKDDRWPDTVKDVCLQPLQFSCWNGGDPNRTALLAIADRFVHHADAKVDALTRECLWVAEGLIRGIVRDRTSGANHYVSRRLWETAPPRWINGASPTSLIQRHAFFKL